MTPLEALESVSLLVGVDSMRRKPGGLVSRCSPEVREALGRLTSEELASARVPEWVGRRGRASL